ncbi:MAG TPA: DUF4032 domain-containing protein [Pyrinomonadaceae bacterium]|nr:DUF4032 domain-containing protein [Pyrinomonadaceae bacterium]
MPLSFKLEHIIEEVVSEHPRDQKRVLRKLTGVKLSTAYAQDVWPQVLEHKWYLSERLGRDVGLRVAAVDYFENIYPPESYRGEAATDSLPPRLPMMMPFGERA